MDELKINRLSSKRSRSLTKGFCCHQEGAMSCRREVMPSVIRQAEVLRSKLQANYPSFSKLLVKSHVTGPFWMALPVSFCKKYLPQEDTCFILENQNGKEYKTRYLAEKTALSGGWRGFAIAESLLEGEALVFHLVSPAKFKVYKIRKNDSVEVDGSLFMQNTDTCRAPCGPGNVELNEETEQASTPSEVLRDEDQEMLLSEYAQRIMLKKRKTGHSNSKHSIGNPRNLDRQAMVGNFGDIISFEDFIIVLDELLKKEHELPRHIKWSYYQLCCGQKVLLHAHLPKDINAILIAGIIIQTVNLANAIRNSELPFFQDEFAILDENLQALEILGMNVRFMRTHLHHLRSIACDPKAAMDRQQCKDLCSQQADTDKEMKILQAKLSELTQEYNMHAANIEKLKSLIENDELRFQEEVSAPW